MGDGPGNAGIGGIDGKPTVSGGFTWYDEAWWAMSVTNSTINLYRIDPDTGFSKKLLASEPFTGVPNSQRG